MTTKEVLEAIGGTITMILFALLAWLFLIATPDQCSAECELIRAEMAEAAQ